MIDLHGLSASTSTAVDREADDGEKFNVIAITSNIDATAIKRCHGTRYVYSHNSATGNFYLSLKPPVCRKR